MDTIILGLLLLKSRSLYELRDRIGKGLNLMYSSSTGSIQAALKKLLQNGYVVYEEKTENGKYKKIYSITPAGREYFGEWVNSPMQAGGNKDPELAKLYFMGLSEKETRIERLEAYIQSLRKVLEPLRFLYEQGRDFKTEEAYRDILNFQFLSVRYGVDNLQFHIDWYTKIVQEMKEEKL